MADSKLSDDKKLSSAERLHALAARLGGPDPRGDDTPAPTPTTKPGWFGSKSPAPAEGPASSKSPGWFTAKEKTEPEPLVKAPTKSEIPEAAVTSGGIPADKDTPGPPSGLRLSVGHRQLPKCDIWEKHLR